MSSLVEKLQTQPVSNDDAHDVFTLMHEAANEIKRLRGALEIVAGGSVDVSNTAIIVGNGAATVMRQILEALGYR